MLSTVSTKEGPKIDYPSPMCNQMDPPYLAWTYLKKDKRGKTLEKEMIEGKKEKEIKKK